MIKDRVELHDGFTAEELETSEGVEALYKSIGDELGNYWRRYRITVDQIISTARDSDGTWNLAANTRLTGTDSPKKAGLLQAVELNLVNTRAETERELWYTPLFCILPPREEKR